MISNIGTSSYYQIQSSSIKSVQAQPEADLSISTINTSKTDSVNISDAAKEMSNIEQDIASRYDVTNMTESERVSMANELFDNDLITQRQHSVMSLPFQSFLAEKTGTMDTYDPNEKFNYLQQRIDQLSFTKSSGASTQEMELDEGIVSILENLNKYRHG